MGNEAPMKLLLSASLYLTYSLTYSHTRSRARALATYWKLLTRYVPTCCARRTETTMTLPGLSIGTSQLLTTVHCGGRSAGMHSAFTPRCRCMKLLHSGSPVPG